MRKYLILILVCLVATPAAATMTSDTDKEILECNGETGPYSYGFKIWNDDDIKVIQTDGNNVDTLLTLTSDYTVSGAGDDAGGFVTLVTACPDGSTLTLIPVLDYTQESDYIDGAPFAASTIENDLDYAVSLSKQTAERTDRAIKFPESCSNCDDIDLARPEADAYLLMNSSADAVIMSTSLSSTATVATIANIEDYSDSLSTAVSAIGSVTKTHLMIHKSINLSVATTVTDNITLWITAEGRIVLGVYALAINGPLEAGLTQIFDDSGGGDVTFGNFVPTVYTQWWGAVPFDVTDQDNSAYFQSALDTGVNLHVTDGIWKVKEIETKGDSQIIFGNGVYGVRGSATIRKGSALVAADTIGVNEYVLKLGNMSGSNTNEEFRGTGLFNISIQGSTTNKTGGDRTQCNGVQLFNIYNPRLDHVQIKYFRGYGMYIDDDVKEGMFTDVHFLECGDPGTDEVLKIYMDTAGLNWPNNLNFVSCRFINSRAVCINVDSVSSTNQCRQIHFEKCMFHGHLSEAPTAYDFIQFGNVQYSTISDCMFGQQGLNVYCINFTNTANQEGNIIRGNLFHMQGSTDPNVGGSGVYVANQKNLLIESNKFYDYRNYAIVIATDMASKYCRVTNNYYKEDQDDDGAYNDYSDVFSLEGATQFAKLIVDEEFRHVSNTDNTVAVDVDDFWVTFVNDNGASTEFDIPDAASLWEGFTISIAKDTTADITLDLVDSYDRFQGFVANTSLINNSGKIGGSITIRVVDLNEWEIVSAHEDFLTLHGSLVWDPANLANAAGETSGVITVTGAAAGDMVEVFPPDSIQAMLCQGYVSAGNQVKVRLQNETGGAIDLDSGTWWVRVHRR
tara:strand:- start:255 stop:2798 length:2544 start_codon:yes stop_codon:yes gene_type:complete